VLVGELPANTRMLVDRYFAGLPGATPPRHAAIDATPLAREVVLRVREAIGRAPVVLAAWRSPALYTADDAVADVLAEALSTGACKRIAAASGEAVFTVSFRQASERGVSSFFAVFAGKLGRPVAEVQAALDEVLARVGAGALSDAEVTRARERMITRNLAGLQDLVGQAGRLQSYAHERGAPDWLAADLERYRAVTPAAVARFAREVLRRDRRVLVLAEPAGSGRP
jgi:zinc protease